MNRLVLLALPCLLLFACTSKEKVDLIVHNAVVYTVDSAFTVAQALAVKDGRFVAAGSNDDVLNRYEANQQFDAQGKAVYPGFIDAHCHFLRYGLGLQHADLTDTRSFAEVVERLVAHRKKYPVAAWIVGRGWDQNDWPVRQFPDRDTLDKLFPGTPVLIGRVDGHAALANGKALQLAGVNAQSKISGGVVEVINGRATGILVDNAVDLVYKALPAATRAEIVSGLRQAERNCLTVGLTTVDDAGLGRGEVALLDSLYRAKGLFIRAYVMLDPSAENRDYYFKNGPYKTDQLNVRSFKVYADGALGSRGACLLGDYHDQPGNRGFLLSSPGELRKLAGEIYQHGFQMNTHCIGDSANRLLLRYYGEVLKGKNDRRWRIEHAQVVSAPDVARFSAFSVIPSVQPTHATSDMYWAGDRLGKDRVQTAYAYKNLLRQNGMLALGSDFPVEDINPLYGFHAAVARQDAKGYPAGGFQMDNALTREEALRGMTTWAAYSNFEEKEKGSIGPGKLADFVVLEADIMKVPVAGLRTVKVRQTFIGGKEVYNRDGARLAAR